MRAFGASTATAKLAPKAPWDPPAKPRCQAPRYLLPARARPCPPRCHQFCFCRQQASCWTETQYPTTGKAQSHPVPGCAPSAASATASPSPQHAKTVPVPFFLRRAFL